MKYTQFRTTLTQFHLTHAAADGLDLETIEVLLSFDDEDVYGALADVFGLNEEAAKMFLFRCAEREAAEAES